MTVTRHGTDESGSALIKVKLSISVSSGSGREPPEVDKEQQSAAAENESCRECRVPRVWDRTEAASVTELVTT